MIAGRSAGRGAAEQAVAHKLDVRAQDEQARELGPAGERLATNADVQAFAEDIAISRSGSLPA